MPPPVIPNVAQMLGQLSTSPPIGPIPTTPYAPVSVAPLQLQQPIPSTPPAPIPPKPFNPFGGAGGFGSLMPPQTIMHNTMQGPPGDRYATGPLQQTPEQARAAALFGIQPRGTAAPTTAPAARPAASSLLDLMQNPQQGNLAQTMLQLGTPPNMQQQILQNLIGGPRGAPAATTTPYYGGQRW